MSCTIWPPPTWQRSRRTATGSIERSSNSNVTSATESPSARRLLSSRAVNIAWAACLFVVSFFVYELSLASSQTRFASRQLEKWNMFGADSNEQTLRGDWSNTAAGKHPLFAVVGEGLF